MSRKLLGSLRANRSGHPATRIPFDKLTACAPPIRTRSRWSLDVRARPQEPRQPSPPRRRADATAWLSRLLLPPERRNKRGRYACAPYGRTPREPSASPSPASSHNAVFCSGARPRRARGPRNAACYASPRSAESAPLCRGPLIAGGRARWSRLPRLGAPRTAQALRGPAAAGHSVSAAYARRRPANVAKPTLSCRLLALRP